MGRGWLVYTATLSSGRRVRGYNPSLLREVERRLRIQLNWSGPIGDWDALSSLRLMCCQDSWTYLNLVDFLLNKVDGASLESTAVETILEEGGSSWRVVGTESGHALQRRLSEGVTAIFDLAMEHGTSASEHLRRAKSAMYGLNPRPNEVYLESVKAIEAAAVPIVSPKNDRASLGSLIRDLKAASSNWAFPLGRKPRQGVEEVISLMELVWQDGEGRHGSPGADSAEDIPHPDAEACLHLSATLVHWFSAGLIVRKNTRTHVPDGP